MFLASNCDINIPVFGSTIIGLLPPVKIQNESPLSSHQVVKLEFTGPISLVLVYFVWFVEIFEH